MMFYIHTQIFFYINFFTFAVDVGFIEELERYTEFPYTPHPISVSLTLSSDISHHSGPFVNATTTQHCYIFVAEVQSFVDLTSFSVNPRSDPGTNPGNHTASTWLFYRRPLGCDCFCLSILFIFGGGGGSGEIYVFIWREGGENLEQALR